MSTDIPGLSGPPRTGIQTPGLGRFRSRQPRRYLPAKRCGEKRFFGRTSPPPTSLIGRVGNAPVPVPTGRESARWRSPRGISTYRVRARWTGLVFDGKGAKRRARAKSRPAHSLARRRPGSNPRATAHGKTGCSFLPPSLASRRVADHGDRAVLVHDVGLRAVRGPYERFGGSNVRCVVHGRGCSPRGPGFVRDTGRQFRVFSRIVRSRSSAPRPGTARQFVCSPRLEGLAPSRRHRLPPSRTASIQPPRTCAPSSHPAPFAPSAVSSHTSMRRRAAAMGRSM